MKKKVFSAGYTIEVVSWENDGDHYNTKSLNVQNLDDVKAINHLCENLFVSESDDESAIGNTLDESLYRVLTYIQDNLEILKTMENLGYKDLPKFESFKEKIINHFDDIDFNDEHIDYQWYELFADYSVDSKDSEPKKYFKAIMNLNQKLLGHTETYRSRVFEEMTVYHTEKDLFLDIIDIDD